jgi:predicted MFS family arabinose efflux permease
MPMAGAAIHYWGSRPVIMLASLVACGVLPVLTVPVSPPMLAATLLFFGASLGAMDVAMNAQAISVQRTTERPIMSGFHALFSVGGLAGAALLGLLLKAGASLIAAAAAIAAVLAAIAVLQHHALLDDRGAAEGTHFRIVPSRRVLLLGALCFISFLAEGAVLDWSAVFLREHRGVALSAAGFGYAAFSVAMVAGRLTGDTVAHRLGTTRVLRLGGALASAGFLIAALVPARAATIAGFVIVGLGAANIVPVLFGAAGRVAGVPAGLALATVTTIAYAGLLLGPALIGFVADATTLPLAFVMVAAMLAVIPFAARS